MEELDKIIGEKLKTIREEKKLSQREVAKKIGIHDTYISKIEKGRIPSVDVLKKICTFYNIDIASLFGEEIKTPEQLKNFGVEWITFIDDMQKRDLSPEEILQIINALKIVNKL